MGINKKFILILFGIIFISLACYLVVSDFSSDTSVSNEWWMFHKYLNHTGYDGTTFTVITGLNVKEFSVCTSCGPVAFDYSSPAVANGCVYIGNRAGYLWQLNASNISQSINYYSGMQSTSSSPAVANGYVYTFDENGSLYQLNASNVSIKYNIFTTAGGSGISSQNPIVYNGYVYIGDNFGTFYQLNASNISKQISNRTTGGVYSSPAVANGYVYVGGFKWLIQLNASNISIQYANFTTGANVRSSPAVANGYVYFGSYDNNTYQLNASNISIQYANFTTGGSIYASPAISNGYLYIGNIVENGEEGAFYQLNASNISIKYAKYGPAFVSFDSFYSSPAVANGYVYVGSGNSYQLYQFNASNISLFKISSGLLGGTGANVRSSPAVANGYVYVGVGSNTYNGVVQLNVSNISLSNNFPYINLVLSSPLAQNYNYNTSLSLNYSASANYGLGSCNYSIVNSSGGGIVISNTNLPSCLNSTFNLSNIDNNYNLNLCSNDTLGNSNCSMVSFGIRMNSPNVVLVSPSSNQYFNNGTNITVNFTASRTIGLDTAQLWGNFNGSFSNNFTWVHPANFSYNFTTLNLSQGQYIFNVKVNDTSNNIGWALNNNTFYVDLTNPNITINLITTTAGSTIVSFTSTEVDNFLIGNCSYTVYDSGNNIIWNNVSYTCGNSLSHIFIVSSFGSYTLQLVDDDFAGNFNVTSQAFTTSASGSPSGGNPTQVIQNNTKTFCGDGICQANGNDYGIKENFYDCPQDCQGSGFNIDEFFNKYLFYCLSNNATLRSQCVWIQLFSIFSIVGTNQTIAVESPKYIGNYNLDTFLLNCFNANGVCYWNYSESSYVIIALGVIILVISLVRIPASSGSKNKVSIPKYFVVKVQSKKRKRR